MKIFLPRIRAGVVFKAAIAGFFLAGTLVFALDISIRPARDSGIYSVGEAVQWTIDFKSDAALIKDAHYQIKTGGVTTVGEGAINFTEGKASIEAEAKNPGWLVLEIKATDADGKTTNFMGGAIVSPEKIKPVLPPPDDFDAFWAAKLKELAQVPPNPVLTPGESGNSNVNYCTIVMDNIRGTHIRGQLARPAKEGKFPALLLLQYAGIYPLQKEWVISKATNGWLALNIQAHDIAVAEPEVYYNSLKAGSLTNYEAIGKDDREASYFLRMYLACYRAAAYLRSRDDWDGRTLVVAGYSQGGQQTLITAALIPDITAAMACVPAGCDSDAVEAGRLPGYPWMLMPTKTPEEAAKVKHASRYFDAANFAPRVKCPLLVGIGGIDVVCPSPGIYAALNRMPCPKEIIFMPTVGHGGPHVAYDARSKEWLSLLKDGKSPSRSGNPTAEKL